MILAVAIIAILAVSAGYYIISVSSASGATIDMFVSDGTPQNGSPDELEPLNFTVTQGQHVTIVFDNTDDGPHALVIPAFGVNTGIVQGGSTVRVSFVPDKSGTFGFYQPEGACNYGGLGYQQGGCTGTQIFNGTVTVLPPP